MKKFAINLAAFGAICVCSYIVLLLIYGYFSPNLLRPNLPYNRNRVTGFSYLRFAEANTVRNVDVLFLGSSHAYRGYDPRIFKKLGLKTFNLGSSAQTLRQTLFLLDTYLEQMNPKVVVLDIYPKFLNLDGVESSIDLFSNTPLGKSALKMAFDVMDIRVFNTILYNFTRGFVADLDGVESPTRSKKGHLNISRGRDVYISGGYAETHRSYATQGAKIPRDEYVFDPEQYEAMLEIKKKLTEKRIKIICIQGPILPARYTRAKNKEKIDSVLNASFSLYYNYNELSILPNNCFSDDQHLNQKGVEIFDEFVAGVLREQTPNLYSIKSKN